MLEIGSKMKYSIICLLFWALINTSLFGQINDADTVNVLALENENVSILQLLTNPSKYHGEEITVSGYLHLKFEDCAFYLSKTQADYLLSEYALWIHFGDSVKVEYLLNGQIKEGNIVDIKYLDCKYVLIRGVFNKNKHGHLHAYTGTIEKIREIKELRKWYDGSKDLYNVDDTTGKILPVENKNN